MQMESPGTKCRPGIRRDVGCCIDTRRLICILGAGLNADGASRKEMSPGRDVSCCLSLLISDDSSAFWERAKMQMESPGKKCRQEKMWAAVSLY